MERSQKIAALEQAMSQLSASDQEFAESLIAQSKRRGLSDRQWPWVAKLVERATTPAPEPMKIGAIGAIVALIDRAKSRLKYPAIMLRAGDDLDLRVSVAGPQSRHAGAVNVTSIERGADGRRSWYGRITPAGQYEPALRLLQSEREAIGQALVCFAEDPAGVAAAYGHLTGRCCFCGPKLDDERSTAVGYGPVCARKWSLPWRK